MSNDIALIKLDKRVRMNSRTQAACLPDTRMEFSAQDECYAVGYGTAGKNLIQRHSDILVFWRVRCNKHESVMFMSYDVHLLDRLFSVV